MSGNNRAYTISIPADDDDVYAINPLGANSPSATLTIPGAAGAPATLVITGTPAQYSSVAIGTLNIPHSLSGRNVNVTLALASGASANVSLAYVHYVRAALLAQGATGVSVTAPGLHLAVLE